jgi:class 3 adenylate cyclase/predicted ATPase
MMFDIRQWLEEQGLGEYVQNFVANHVDEQTLPELTADDLKELGVNSIGHRRRLLNAASKLAHPENNGDAAKQPAADAGANVVATQAAERRNLTILFVDLVGSTELSGRLDPEDLRALLQSYQDAVVAAIVRHQGYVANIVGDGIVAYFGWPKAFEGQAVRAVSAALAATAAVAKIVSPDGRRLAARAGATSGSVVVGNLDSAIGRQSGVISGEAPNLAARLQGLASSDKVVISAATQRLVAGYFEFEDLGVKELKGFVDPVRVYEVGEERAVYSRFEAISAAGLTPLIGRAEELVILHRRWEQALQGRGQAVLVEGEPGIGKSRLMRALEEQVAGDTPALIEWRCSFYHQNSAFFPVIEHCRRLLEFKSDEVAHDRILKLEQMLGKTGLSLVESVPIFATLLSLPVPPSYPPLTLDPERLKQKTFEVLIGWLKQWAHREPVPMIVEDLHWIDPSTLELLGLLVEHIDETRLLVISTFRPDFRPPWPMFAHVTQLKLNRLSHAQIEEMVERIAAGYDLPADMAMHVARRTDGVPLFVEEMTKDVIERYTRSDRQPIPGPQSRGVSPGEALAIPESLQDLLMARLDRLGDAKEVAQIAAVLGREFDYELVAVATSRDAESLERALSQLVDSELIFQRGRPPQAHYLFKHTLIQDAAYQSLLRSTRQRYHELIGRTIETRRSETVETQPELLAYHFTEAGLAERAISYWRNAGRRSIHRSANLEAINHLTQALELCRSLPETAENLRRELALQIAIGVPLRAVRGFASPEVGKAYVRALDLCQRVGDATDFIPVLRGLWEYHELRAEYRSSRALGERLLAMATEAQDSSALLIAHNVLGDNLFWLGEFTGARSHLERGTALYDAQQDNTHVHLYGYDVGVACLIFGAWTLWFLGYPDKALGQAHAALELARKVSHLFSITFGLQFLAQLHHYRGEPTPAQELATQVVQVSTQEGFPIWFGMGIVIEGWALAMEGREEGVSKIMRGLENWRATGHELERPHFLCLLADAYNVVNQPEKGIAALAEAYAETDRTGEGFWSAELHRVHGELLIRAAASPSDGAASPVKDTPQPEALFLKAIEIARGQQAKSLELRASISLARLWQRQGRITEARQLLEAIYRWFSEGFDTPDLKAADQLLRELAP